MTDRVETVQLPNGDLYVGSIANGKPHGEGRLLGSSQLPLRRGVVCSGQRCAAAARAPAIATAHVWHGAAARRESRAST